MLKRQNLFKNRMIPPEKETKNLKNKMEKLRRKLKVINQNTIIWGDF